MNVEMGYLLYLFGAFAAIALALFNIIPTNYLGGVVIAYFIVGLCFAWLNAIRQGEKMAKTERQEALVSPHEPEQEMPDREEEPLVA